MERPDNCSEELYDLMMKCWREDPQERPQFAELVKTVEDMLCVGMDYLDLGCLAGVSNREYFMNSSTEEELIPKGNSTPQRQQKTISCDIKLYELQDFNNCAGMTKMTNFQ